MSIKKYAKIFFAGFFGAGLLFNNLNAQENSKNEKSTNQPPAEFIIDSEAQRVIFPKQQTLLGNVLERRLSKNYTNLFNPSFTFDSLFDKENRDLITRVNRESYGAFRHSFSQSAREYLLKLYLRDGQIKSFFQDTFAGFEKYTLTSPFDRHEGLPGQDEIRNSRPRFGWKPFTLSNPYVYANLALDDILKIHARVYYKQWQEPLGEVITQTHLSPNWSFSLGFQYRFNLRDSMLSYENLNNNHLSTFFGIQGNVKNGLIGIGANANGKEKIITAHYSLGF